MHALRPALLALALTLPATTGVGQSTATAAVTVDQAAVDFLREHGLEHSRVMEHLSWICDVHGPRLTGSANLRRAQEWALETLRGWGLREVHLEEWGPFGDGWQLEHFAMHVTGENPWPVHAWPKAWSPSLAGRVEARVVNVSTLTAEELETADLSDAVVMIEPPREVSEPFETEARRLEADDLLNLVNGTRGGGASRAASPETVTSQAERMRDFQKRRAMEQMVYAKKPVAILDRSYKGDYGTIFTGSASVPAPAGTPRDQRPRPWSPGEHQVVPQFTLAVEHYNRIQRMIEKGVDVRLALELRATFDREDPMERNVLAEIPGVDPEHAAELVMLGAHFDSWHAGTGATDNGCGSAVMMEATRLLKLWVDERGEGPRRTIRVALWSGEEQGLLGSRAYVTEHFAERGERGAPLAEIKPEHALLSGYFNLDNGTGRVRGVYLQGNDAVAPIFREWLRPFHDLDAATVTRDDTGGTDHLAFDAVGLPGFQFIQDPVAYSPRTHHSNMDNWDHAVADDLRQAATIIASFVWHTAQRDDLLPRKPLPGEPAQPAAAESGTR